MMYSVVDVAELNSISRRVLGNAANALAGALRFPLPQTTESTKTTALGRLCSA